MNFKKIIKHHFEEIIATKIEPNSIAMGFAVGSFFAILPTPGFSILLGFLVLLIFSKINKYSLFIAMAFWNPITLIPVYSLSYYLGNKMFSTLPVQKFNLSILNQIYNFSRRFLVGNIMLAFLISIFCYFFVYIICKNYIKKNKIKF